jgi:hypothetical protein
MSTIIANYNPATFPLRIPDTAYNPPPISGKDYLISPNSRAFLFKNKSGVVTNVTIAFSGYDNLYFNNTIFTSNI